MGDVDIREVDALVEEQIDTGAVIQGEDQQKEILTYAKDEVESVLSGSVRKEFLDNVQIWRRQRIARPESASKSFPWPNASNVAVPLAMTNTNGITSMLKQTIMGRKPFWSVEPAEKKLIPHAKALEALLDAMANSPYHLNLANLNNSILYETASLGTQFVKIPWTIDRWSFKRSGPSGMEQVSKVVKDSPEVIPLRLEDTLTQPFWYDPQRAPWFATRVWLTKHELQQRSQQGIYQNVDKVLERGQDPLDEEWSANLERLGIDPSSVDSGLYAIIEMYLFWDVDGDGTPEDIIIWFDPKTDTLLRSEFNELGVRPFVRIPYLTIPNMLYGIGVGHMTQHLQDEIDALHNMRVDGTQLAMLQMYVTKRGGPLTSTEQFRPLKNIAVDDPSKDFLPVKFPDLSPGTIQAEMIARDYAGQATGADGPAMGNESRTSYGTRSASGAMFLAQQQNKIFASAAENVSVGYSDMGQIITFQLVRNKARVKQLYPLVSEEHWGYLDEVLNMGTENIPYAFRFTVRTTDIEKTEEAKRQTYLTLAQLYTAYGREVFQMLPMIYNPQIPPPIQQVAMKFFIGATELMGRILELFGEKDKDALLPYVKDLALLTQAMEAQREQSIARMAGQIGQIGGTSERNANSAEMGPGGGGGTSFGGSPGRPGLEGAAEYGGQPGANSPGQVEGI